MNGPVLAFLFICLVIVVLIVFVRPRMKPRGKLALPKSVGLDASIEDLKEDHQKYDLYYCGRKAAPSALLFVPKDGAIRWVLSDRKPGGWRIITDEALFTDLFARINDTDTGVVNQLKVALPPGDIQGRTQDLCLIYTAGSTTSYRQGEDGNTYVLSPVPERTKRDFDRNK
ncbi:hypothetical protein [Desulfoplanes sp.]